LGEHGKLSVRVNGSVHERAVEPRLLLSDFLLGIRHLKGLSQPVPVYGVVAEHAA